MKDLGTLGGDDSYGYAINDHGQVVGYSTLAGGGQADQDTRGFIWSNGRMHDLGTLPDGRGVRPIGINNRGEIVGVYVRVDSQGFPVQQRTFFYRGRIHDLTELVDPAQGWTITTAEGINDAGQIAGAACRQSGTCMPVRLDPVPKDGRAGDGANGEHMRQDDNSVFKLPFHFNP